MIIFGQYQYALCSFVRHLTAIIEMDLIHPAQTTGNITYFLLYFNSYDYFVLILCNLHNYVFQFPFFFSLSENTQPLKKSSNL